jgi:hypothetical protein
MSANNYPCLYQGAKEAITSFALFYSADWYTYGHPQFGKIESGGGNPLFNFWKPPPGQLDAEIEPKTQWLIWHNLILPKMEILITKQEHLSDGLWKITAVAQNTGWLSTI